MPTLISELKERYRLVDCSYIIDTNTPAWPGGQGLLKCPFSTVEQSGFAKEGYVMGGDIGTHIDTPSHCVAGGRSVSDLTVDELMGEIVLIDVQESCEQDPDYALQVSDITQWEETFGAIPSGAIVCMRTGWAARAGAALAYRNADADGVMHFPGFSRDAAEWLTTQRQISGIGIDTLSLDPGSSTTFDCHQVMLGQDKWQIENLILDDIPAQGAMMIALPLNVRGAPESETRVVALVPR